MPTSGPPPTLVEQLHAAARDDDVATLTGLLDADSAALYARAEPYGWTLLHTAAQSGRLAVVDLLLRRGLDPDVREHGDRTYAMHWAAAGGHRDVVRRLADAGAQGSAAALPCFRFRPIDSRADRPVDQSQNSSFDRYA